MLFLKKNELRECQKQEEARTITDMVVGETKKIFELFHLEVNNRFREIQAQIRQLDTNIELLERKLVIKDMSDKRKYGQLHYKLHEVKDTTIKDEIDGIKRKLHLVAAEDDKLN